MSQYSYSFGEFELLTDIPHLDVRPPEYCTQKPSIHIRKASDTENAEFMYQEFVWQCPLGTFHVYKTRFGYTIHFPNIAIFYLSTEESLVLYQLHPQATLDTTRHLLLDHVLPRYMAYLGHFVLHSAAIVTGSRTILLLGESGAGKSTLAAYLATSEEKLLSDDAVVARADDNPVRIRPTYPALRLWRPSIEGLYKSWPKTVPVAHNSSKYRVGSTAGNVIWKDPPGLMAIFQLARGTDKGELSIVPVRLREACMLLLRSAFQLDPRDRNALRRSLNSAANIAAKTPVFNLHYPTGFGQLGDVHQAINQHLIDLPTNYSSVQNCILNKPNTQTGPAMGPR